MSGFDHLITSQDAADQASAAALRFRDGVSELMRFVRAEYHTGGFGTLPSGLALEKKYADLTLSGPGSLITMLQGHVDVATKLADTFTDMGRKYEEADRTAAESLRSQDAPK